MRFSPDNEMSVALANARRATRRGDAAAVERWLKIADRLMSVAVRLDMHRWMRDRMHGQVAAKARTSRIAWETRKWKADAAWPELKSRNSKDPWSD